MKDYGGQEKDIQALKEKVRDLQTHSEKFNEYQKAKKELEFGMLKQKSSSFSNLDFMKPEKDGPKAT